ncbi:hypothetical protein [Halomicrococcus sp. NG-SE-24]|uniref:hypothetical protein n=1 Tax=Halomicrococcus sp. NG-SE-24 TaxID=3436928 RepID=UPI003D9540F5
MASFTETLDELLPGHDLTITLDDGTTMEGRASPVRYVPDDRFRIEIDPADESIRRCEVSSKYVDGAWEPPQVRHYALGDDDWTVVGEAENLQISR